MFKAIPWVLVPLVNLGCVAIVGNGVEATETRDVAGATSFEQASFFKTAVRIAAGSASLTLTCDDNLLDDITSDVDIRGRLLLRARDGASLLPRTDCHAELTIPELSALIDSGSGDIIVATDVAGLRYIGASGSGDVSINGTVLDAENIVSAGSGDIELGEVIGCDLSVKASGSGDVTVRALQACDATVLCSGSGTIELSGEADSAVVESTGSGGVEAESFVVGDADVTASGSGDVSLGVLDSLVLFLTGSGDVFIYGHPPIRDMNDSGSGDCHFI